MEACLPARHAAGLPGRIIMKSGVKEPHLLLRVSQESGPDVWTSLQLCTYYVPANHLAVLRPLPYCFPTHAHGAGKALTSLPISISEESCRNSLVGCLTLLLKGKFNNRYEYCTYEGQVNCQVSQQNRRYTIDLDNQIDRFIQESPIM